MNDFVQKDRLGTQLTVNVCKHGTSCKVINERLNSSRKHVRVIYTPLNPTFI